MTFPGRFERLISTFFLFCAFTFQGFSCELVVSPLSPTRVNALSGSSVTLAVSFSGAADPVVTWLKGNLPVATWTISSTSSPDIAENSKDVLRIEKNGSLTFVNVPLRFAGDYTVEMTKSGLEKVSTTFTLKLFEHIQDVNLTTQPDFVKEGTDMFSLQYSMVQGVVEQQTWHFNGKELTNSSHYLVVGKSLMILKPNRSDTGQYAVLLMNPFSNVTAHKNVTVIYGPDEPILEAHPDRLFYVAGDSLSLSCQAKGFPQPSVEWVFGRQILPDTHKGVLNLTNVQTRQGGVYTCSVLNDLTKEKRQKNVKLDIYERPLGSPGCSVMSGDNINLKYQCEWVGGTPQAQLSFPELNNTLSGAGNLSLTVSASTDLNKKTVICMADHPIEQKMCNITASSPADFLPAVRISVGPDDKIVVTLLCVSEASPRAVVSWSKDGEVVTSETRYQISNDTTQLIIRHYNVTNYLLHNYTCTCRNPLGTKRRQIRLQGPSISDSSLFPNQDGTIITLTWEVPPTSVVTGEGLSGSAIAGIAAGIPCSILALVLLCSLIYLVIYYSKGKSHQTRYPVSRAVEKARTTQLDVTPHNRLPGALKAIPDYNRLQQTPSERSMALPSFVPPPPVRVATTV